MLGARINVIQPQIRNLIAYLLPLPDKKPTTTVLKRDKTSGLDRNDRQKCSYLQRTLLIRKGSIKYCLLLLWARLKISREKTQQLYAGCVHFTVDWLFWNLYGSYIAPRSLLSWKKPGNFSFDNMGPLSTQILQKSLYINKYNICNDTQINMNFLKLFQGRWQHN